MRGKSMESSGPDRRDIGQIIGRRAINGAKPRAKRRCSMNQHVKTKSTTGEANIKRLVVKTASIP